MADSERPKEVSGHSQRQRDSARVFSVMHWTRNVVGNMWAMISVLYRSIDGCTAVVVESGELDGTLSRELATQNQSNEVVERAPSTVCALSWCNDSNDHVHDPR